jgi:uncharacterized protein
MPVMNDVADILLETIVHRLRELTPVRKAEGVTRLCLFGSRARGDARPDSDLDVLIDMLSRSDKPASDLFKVTHLIEDAVGLKVQVSIRALLKPRIAERIADDLIEVF